VAGVAACFVAGHAVVLIECLPMCVLRPESTALECRVSRMRVTPGDRVGRDWGTAVNVESSTVVHL